MKKKANKKKQKFIFGVFTGGGGGQYKSYHCFTNERSKAFQWFKFWYLFRKFQRELVLPFLWAQDGFDTPSPEMADAIRLGLDIPAKGKRLVG